MNEKLKDYAKIYLKECYSSDRKFVRLHGYFSNIFEVQYNGVCLAKTDLVSHMGDPAIIETLCKIFQLSYSDSESVILEHIGLKK